MSNKMQRIILPTAVLGVLGGLILISKVAPVKAYDGQPNAIIQKLVDKFGLKQEDVQAVFSEVRQERQTGMQTQFEQRLTQAVTDGKLTEEQKQLVLGKHKQLALEKETNLAAGQNLTPEERRTQAQEQRGQLEQWANDNGIDLSLIGPMGEGRFGMGDRGEGRGMMMGQEDNG